MSPAPQTGAAAPSPIHVSGHSPGALRRAAALGQGWYGWFTDPEQTKAIVEDLTARLVTNSRTIEGFQITVTPPPGLALDAATLHAYEAAGVDLLSARCSWPRKTGLEQALAPLSAILEASHVG